MLIIALVGTSLVGLRIATDTAPSPLTTTARLMHTLRSALTAPEVAASNSPVEFLAAPDWAPDMVDDINRARAAQNAAPVALCAPLTTAAAHYAKSMADHNHFHHIGVDGSTPLQRARRAGYHGHAVSENIAMLYDHPTRVQRAWQLSPGHHAAMVDPAHRHVGVARHGTWWVQLLGDDPHC